ncbi:Uncharacterised protein [Mycobacteroides abscessus subsp. abscessus]|nr:Uncharacterised protein [Mycobacteroides abscessus subsp. abscessus]
MWASANRLNLSHKALENSGEASAWAATDAMTSVG